MIFQRDRFLVIVITAIVLLSGCTALSKDISSNIAMAEQGDAVAQYRLGLAYTNGYGVNQDYSQAMNWFLKAAQQGQADAQFMSGVAYAAGRGVPRDIKVAYGWFDKAASQGHRAALYQKAEALANGRGIAKNVETSQKVYEAAARKGHVESKYALGTLIMTGRGGERNTILGSAWILTAANAGHKGAQTLSISIKEKLSSSDWIKVKSLAERMDASFALSTCDNAQSIARLVGQSHIINCA
ncbi:sel1 repeat family protein [Vibrio kasasachensis]|uniref:tetratricopeptide repeat protein n=1 Tax=Vibrio kasasachensis TaxID=2910248 RepID=UPI003D11E28C